MAVFVLAFHADQADVDDVIARLARRDGTSPQEFVQIHWGSQGPNDAAGVYRRVVAEVEAQAGSACAQAPPGGHGMVLVDQVQFENLSPHSEGMGDWQTAVAMLMLTYPEFRWHLAAADSVSGFPTGMQCRFDASDRVFTFDADGRRDALRDNIRGTGGHVVQRNAHAAAIDDEESFAQLHAYVAYRCGHRAEVITRWASLVRHVGPEASAAYTLLLEDMSLRFPDRPQNVHIIDLQQRAKRFPGLELGQSRAGQPRPARWLVTAGQDTAAGQGVLQANQAYLAAWAQRVDGQGGSIAKPVAGIYDLIDKAKLHPMDFAPAMAEPLPADGGHGAPGKLALVARTLIERARAIRAANPSLESALLAAVCALDALELTAGDSPTLAFDALKLRHECEVIAECSFAGLQHSIGVQKRFKDITASIKQLGRGYAAQNAARACTNAEMSIVTGVMRVFREHARFSEEMECLNRLRDLEMDLVRLRKPSLTDKGSFAACLGWLPSLYFKALIRSPACFVVVIVGWLLLLALGFWAAGPPAGEAVAAASAAAVAPAATAASSASAPVAAASVALAAPAQAGAHVARVFCAVLDSVTAFFSMGSPVHPKLCEGSGGWEIGYHLVTAAAIVLGALHMGIFISYIYTLLSRR